MVKSNIWGKHAWKFMHYVTMGYPENPTEEHKNNYKNFFISLKYVLPCSICAKHYEENLEKLPLTEEVLSNRNNLIKWGIDLHNMVNKMLNKNVLSYEYAYNLLLNNNNISDYDNNENNFDVINNSNIDNTSNYAKYSKSYDNNMDKYYKTINEQIETPIEKQEKQEKQENTNNIITKKNNNYNNFFNPLILLIILLGLIFIVIIIKKK
jgi:hypothetical protein